MRSEEGFDQAEKENIESIQTCILCNSYLMVCLHIRGDNPLFYTAYISVDVAHNEIFSV